MKTPIKFLLFLLGAVIVLGLALPFLLPASVYKGPLEKAVTQATGRTLTISGDLSLKFLPRFVIEVEDAELANVEGAADPVFARIERLIVGVNPMALTRREVEVTRFVLERPEINLELSQDGTPNWELTPSENLSASPAEAGQSGGLSDEISNLSLGDVRLIDGAFRYSNHQTGVTHAFSGVNMTLELADLDSPFEAKGSLTYNQKTIELKARVGHLSALSRNTETPISLSITSPLFDIAMDGKYQGGSASHTQGHATVHIWSLEQLSRWLGSPLEGISVPDKYSFEGDLSVQGSRYGIENAKISMDDMSGTGALGLNTSGKVPSLTGRLDLDKIDLRPYMAEPTEQGQEGETSVTTQWSNEVLDLTGLRELNSSLEITAKEFRAFDYEVSQTAMVVNLKGGVLKADLNRLDLYKGLGVGSFVLDGSQTVPRLTMRLDLADVDAEPFLMAATSKRLATGKGQFTLDAHTSGRSQKEWMDRLAGKGHLFLHDGELIGVDLNKMVLILGSLTGYQPEGQREEEAVEGEVGENRSTEFVEMGGTFLIANGILQSQDFKLENTLVNLAGSGDVDIGEQMIDFRIDPGLNREDGGLKLALKVTGPWHDMAFRPDMQQMVRQKLMETLGVEEDSPVGQILDLFNRKTKKQPEPSD